MAQKNVNIRMDEDLKKEAEALFSELGLNMSTAVNIFIRQALRQGGIPFEVSTHTDPFYQPENLKRLKESIEQLKKHDTVTKTSSELGLDDA
ncbi:DNA-damage-inducible protein J [Aureibacillus halotolerans]|uniref:DNA-damage-inducible protein J n=2 Tax=Aureibacillus halotolerans TaxID=1508390 RepID=A0A4R6U1L3_9BACI|nr:type II toxin-antitoxin system RelB/DinJ family antitoxin [Aureibacillus halotolerans]TDQ38309.1 DNA-damage-inducible protein J [Aureibacillus halotolerans]